MGPLLWSGVGAPRRDPRATETEPRESGGGTRDSEGDRGRVGTPYGREDDGRTEEEAEENATEPATGKTQPRQSTIPRRYAWKGEENEPGSGVRNEVERPTGTGRKEGEGTGRKQRETRVDKGGEIR